MTISVLLVDDHPVVRHGLRALLSATPDLAVVAEAACAAEAMQRALEHQPVVVLMDLVLPDMEGSAAIAQISRQCPGSRVVVLTNYHDEVRMLAAMQAGALSFLLKDARPNTIVQAVRAAARGDPTFDPLVTTTLLQARIGTIPMLLQRLTERERMVLICLGRGLSNAAIATELHMSEGTVRTHISHLLPKLEVQDRTQAALFAMRARLVERHE